MHWHSYVDLFKTMIVNSFPPLLPLDGTKKDLAKVDIEKLLLKELALLSSHIDLDKRRESPFAAFSSMRFSATH